MLGMNITRPRGAQDILVERPTRAGGEHNHQQSNNHQHNHQQNNHHYDDYHQVLTDYNHINHDYNHLDGDEEDERLHLVVESLTSFWHVPAVAPSTENEAQSSSSLPKEEEHWKAVGSPPRRGFAGRSSFSSSPGSSSIPSAYSPSNSSSSGNNLSTSPQSYFPWSSFDRSSAQPQQQQQQQQQSQPLQQQQQYDSRYTNFLGSDDQLFGFDESFKRDFLPDLEPANREGGLASSLRRNPPSQHAPSSMEMYANGFTPVNPNNMTAASDPPRLGGLGGFGGLGTQHYGHSSVAVPLASPGVSATSSPLPIPSSSPGAAPLLYSPGSRGWADVVSSKPLISPTLGVSIPKDGGQYAQPGWSVQSSPPTGGSPSLMSTQFPYAQESPRKQDGFPAQIAARRSSQSEFEYQGDDGPMINGRRRSSVQKIGSPGGKGMTRKLDYTAPPAAGQEARFFRIDFKSGRSGIYYLDKEKAKKIDPKVGDLVMVEADRGRDLGVIISEEKPDRDAKKVFRLPTHSEVNQLPAKAQDEAKALALCQSKIKQRKLPMEVVEAEYQWDRRKLTYYFVADRRIDFRELVRELFKIYKTRIWMCSVEESRAYELKHNTATGSTNSLFVSAVSSAHNSGRYTDDPVDDEEEVYDDDDDYGNGNY